MSVSTKKNLPDNTASTPQNRLPETDLSETEYLQREIAAAKVSLQNTWTNLGGDLQESADPRTWVQRFPWASLGVAAVAGFTLANAVVPGGDETLREKLSRLKPSAKPASAPAESPQVASAPVAANSIWSSLFDLARLVLESVIVAAFRASLNDRPPPTRDEL